jgi:hypothetical protein
MTGKISQNYAVMMAVTLLMVVATVRLIGSKRVLASG